MESARFDRQRGQILVQVALMVGVLFAFVALALDGGNIYAGRRRMQNAADAGALAGAQEICFGGYDTIEAAHTAALSAAHEYAEDRNDAQTASVGFPNDYMVAVTAVQTLDTFFAGVIGIDTANVRAEAAAQCSGAQSAGGLWPLAFKQDVYTDINRIPCNENFMVFHSNDASGPDLNCAEACCYNADGSEKDEEPDDCECSGRCNCPAIGTHFATDERGWLLFPDPGEDRPDECNAHSNCGANELDCWLEYDHPGPIQVGDCIPGQPGTTASAKTAVQTRIGDVVNIILWDEEVCEIPPDGCPGDPYHVADFGCVEVVGWEQAYKLSTWGSNATCKTFHAVVARKICEGNDGYDECFSSSGQGTGNPRDWELRAVSLVQ